MCAQIDALLNLDAYECVGAFGDRNRTVVYALEAGEILEFVDIATRLEAEALYECEVSLLAEYGSGEYARFLHHLASEGALFDADRYLIGFYGYLL